MSQRQIAWVERGPDDRADEASKSKFSRDPKTCTHSYAFDEPPQCALCGSWICGVCKVLLRHPIGLCARCADEAVRS